MKTQTARTQFSRHIRGFVKQGADYGKPYGVTTDLVKVEFFTTLRPNRRLSLLFQPEVKVAMQAIAATMLQYNYPIREWASGSLSWRNIAGMPQHRIDKQVQEQYPIATSLHAHAVALDINPSANPYSSSGRTDFPPRMVDAWKGIRTESGQVPYRFGMDWGTPDTMHVESTGLWSRQAYIDDPIDLATVQGWGLYNEWLVDGGVEPPGYGDEEMAIKIGDKGPWVSEWQEALNKAHEVNGIPGDPIATDGVFGSKTAAAVTRYQRAANVKVSGEIDWQTAAYLDEYHPRLADRNSRPGDSGDIQELTRVVNEHVQDVVTNTPHT